MRAARRALIAWILLLSIVWLAALLRGVHPVDGLADVLAAVGHGPWAVAALAVAYALRSILLLPMTLLTVFAGFLVGPWLGTAVALAGSVGSAAATYGLARWLRGEIGPEVGPAEGFRARRLAALRARPFETVLVARLAAVPGDVLNVVAGAWRIPLATFCAATAIGGLPGVLAGVFAGASIEGAFTWSGLRIRPWLVVLSAAMLVVSLLLSAWVRRRERSREPTGREERDREGRTDGQTARTKG